MGKSSRAGQPGQAGDVVRVFVRDEDAGQGFRRARQGGHPQADLAPAQAGVHQNPRLLRFQIRAIAPRTTAQNRQLNRHGLTLEGPFPASNLFRKN
jgi:hypothetical protein